MRLKIGLENALGQIGIGKVGDNNTKITYRLLVKIVQQFRIDFA